MNFSWHKEAATQWNGRAENWQERSKEMWDQGSRKSIIPFLAQHIPANSVVGDLGCGDGYGSHKLVEAGYNVVGVDISEEMTERAKRAAAHTEECLTFRQGDLIALPFEDGTFDGVMAINSIEWVEQPLRALNEIKRVVKSGGKLCLGLLGPTAGPRDNSYQRLYENPVIMNTMMPWEFERLAKENGWKYVDGKPVYKDEVEGKHSVGLPKDLQQSLSFMWLFMLEKVE
ncbi:methyltransferase [Pontibacillus halophilus JSM 076056 = DSM 19796]|uniref:Methyltransferase n=1 Tax=Pontibacillus halophilus JSM 076056 = DSM 19796 TaxID=1385510 RepID=A0A0A5GQM4_9BACI|nr:class I SAM-dependent methyltransferase [Pontibacillus halophilus]KGX93508.1 methyltransferase [Pontibacillus halophilus JSM 076056 = DSM 19796]